MLKKIFAMIIMSINFARAKGQDGSESNAPSDLAVLSMSPTERATYFST